MTPKLLILPSWYISAKDKINGSFFQSQGRLVADHFETRVVFCKFSTRPSFRKILTNPKQSAREWSDFVISKDGQIELPDEDVFEVPKLYYYERRIPLIAKKLTYEKYIVDWWVKKVDHMINSGWRPDLIRAHTVFPAGIVAKRIKELHNIPYVISEHAPFSILNYKKSLRPEIKSVFEKSDLVLSLGYDKVRQLAMSRIEVEPNIIFNMVDEELFKGLAEGYTAREPLRLVTIGAASFYKDHDTLLKGVRSALDLGIPLHLTIIGLKVWGGDKLAETLQLIDDLDLGPHTTMIDRLGREEVADILPEFDVFLLTSIQEGFPNSVLEALASGLFVIATRHGGTEDLITDSVGRIIPVRNYKMVGDILSKIFYGDISFDPKDIRSFVVRECGREAYTKKILSYYRLAMEQNSSKV